MIKPHLHSKIRNRRRCAHNIAPKLLKCYLYTELEGEVLFISSYQLAYSLVIAVYTRCKVVLVT